MSYEIVKARIRNFLNKYNSRISVGIVAQEINASREVARKALEMLCKDRFLVREDREYRIK